MPDCYSLSGDQLRRVLELLQIHASPLTGHPTDIYIRPRLDMLTFGRTKASLAPSAIRSIICEATSCPIVVSSALI